MMTERKAWWHEKTHLQFYAWSFIKMLLGLTLWNKNLSINQITWIRAGLQGGNFLEQKAGWMNSHWKIVPAFHRFSYFEIQTRRITSWRYRKDPKTIEKINICRWLSDKKVRQNHGSTFQFSPKGHSCVRACMSMGVRICVCYCVSVCTCILIMHWLQITNISIASRHTHTQFATTFSTCDVRTKQKDQTLCKKCRWWKVSSLFWYFSETSRLPPSLRRTSMSSW